MLSMHSSCIAAECQVFLALCAGMKDSMRAPRTSISFIFARTLACRREHGRVELSWGGVHGCVCAHSHACRCGGMGPGCYFNQPFGAQRGKLKPQQMLLCAT